MGAVVIGPVGVASCVVCETADSAGVMAGAAVGIVVIVVNEILLLLPLGTVDAPHSTAKLTKMAATALRRTVAMIGKLARSSGARG